MPGPTTESLASDLKEFRGEFRKTADEVIRIGTEVGIFKWLIGLLLVSTLGGIGTGIWWAATLTGRVGGLEDRVTKVDARLDRVEGRLTGIESRLGEMDKRLDRIEGNIGRVLDRLSPGGPPVQEKR